MRLEVIHRECSDEGEWMRCGDARSGELFSYVDLERRMPAGHPLRKIRVAVNAALAGVGLDLEAIYSRIS
jgi:hypothetical protein